MTRTYALTTLASLLVLASCSASETPPNDHSGTAQKAAQAPSHGSAYAGKADLDGKTRSFVINSGSGQALGEVALTPTRAGSTHVNIKIAGISPGMHAMHFHETGKCEGPDFKSAGGHFNPSGADHGMDMPNGPHAGDMMNIEIAADGTGELTLVNDRLAITAGGALPALMDADGAALIIHEKADDFKSQPSGAAGARIGCALITSN
jgi:Cu-Zn family superoxide dismutase